MGGVVQFFRGLVFLAFVLGAAGALVESTGCLGHEAVKVHQNSKVIFRVYAKDWGSRQLVEN